jgi:hypothetical protein
LRGRSVSHQSSCRCAFKENTYIAWVQVGGDDVLVAINSSGRDPW